MGINDDRYGKEELGLNIDAEDKVTAPNFETEDIIVVETVNKGYYGETEKCSRYSDRQRYQTSRYNSTFRGKKYEDRYMLLNFEDT